MAVDLGPATTTIVGLGMTRFGKVFGVSSAQLAATAVERAVQDAGLNLGQLDGLLVSSGLRNDVTPMLACDLGLRELSLVASMNTYGATANTMVAECARAIADGTATTIACVFEIGRAHV